MKTTKLCRKIETPECMLLELFRLVQVTESRVTRRNLGGSTTSSTSSSTPTPTLESLAAALEGTDPLTQFAHQEMDPLSKMAADMVCT